MNRKWCVALAFCLFLLLSAAGSAPLHAQTAGETATAESLDGEFRDLYQALKAKADEFVSLREQIAEAQGEDREALSKLATELATELVEDLEGLSGNVVAREEDGLDATTDRETVRSMYEGVSEHFRAAITTLNERLATLRSERDEAAPEDLGKINIRIVEANADLDSFQKILVTQVERREAFKLDTSTERKFLIEVLSDRAELLAGRIELATDDLEILSSRAKTDPENVELAAEIESLDSRLDRYVGRLSLTAELMEKLGLETAEYQQLLFEVTGEITTGLLSREVLGSILKSWKDNTLEWLTTIGPRIFFKVVLFLLILFVFRILAKIARRVVRKAIKSSNLRFSQLLERTALSLTGTAVMIFGLLVALSQLGVEVAPLLAGLGVVGFIVGFALQDTLSNFAAGFMILLYRPYDVGDLIDTAGAFGKVENMTLVSTTLLTLDHQTLVIPNSKIWGDVIKNVTAQKVRRIDMVFGISYTDDIPNAERILEEIVVAHDRVLETPEPMIKLHNLGESSVDFVVRPWAKTDDYWDVYWDITREVKLRFDAEGVSIPFPQRDVHIINEGSETQS